MPESMTNGTAVSNKALRSTQLLLDFTCRTCIATLHLYVNNPICPIVTGDKYKIGPLTFSLGVSENAIWRRKFISFEYEKYS